MGRFLVSGRGGVWGGEGRLNNPPPPFNSNISFLEQKITRRAPKRRNAENVKFTKFPQLLRNSPKKVEFHRKRDNYANGARNTQLSLETKSRLRPWAGNGWNSPENVKLARIHQWLVEFGEFHHNLRKSGKWRPCARYQVWQKCIFAWFSVFLFLQNSFLWKPTFL